MNSGRGNDLGYSKNTTDVTMHNPQPSPKYLYKGAVQRLDGNGRIISSRNHYSLINYTIWIMRTHIYLGYLLTVFTFKMKYF